MQVYELDSSGNFMLQVTETEAELAWAWSTSVSHLGVAVTPLIAGDPAGVIHAILANATVAQSFIAASVAEATLRGYSGYNLDAEGPVTNAYVA
jgi:spore germination protein YaaH